MTSSGVPVGDTTLLQRLRELDEKATPGPWGLNAGYECYGIQSQAPGEPIVSPTWDTREEDARFICELRNALPAVVTLIEAAQEKREADADLARIKTLTLVEFTPGELDAAYWRVKNAGDALSAALAPFVGEAT